MLTALTLQRTDLREKREALTHLRAKLAERELDLTDLRNRLRTFEARYMAQVGTLYAQLDDLEARIAEAEVFPLQKPTPPATAPLPPASAPARHTRLPHGPNTAEEVAEPHRRAENALPRSRPAPPPRFRER